MGKRIVFEFLVSYERYPSKWKRVSELLDSAGATFVKTPSGEPPYVLTAVLPDETNLEDFLNRLRVVEGVGRADEDAWREAF